MKTEKGMGSSKLGWLVFLTCGLLFCERSHAVLVNGSFEQGLIGWTANNAGVAINPSGANASDGTNFVTLGAGNISGSTLAQSFFVSAGATYSLSFDVTFFGIVGSTGIVRTELSTILGTLVSQTFTNSGTPTLPKTYQTVVLAFTVPLNETNLTLKFSDLSPNGGTAIDPLIDNVKINLSLSSTNLPSPPLITSQPQSLTVIAGTNVTFTVEASGGTPILPTVSSGTMKLWLKADAGVIMTSNRVSEWRDQSTNANHASQEDTNKQPVAVNGGAQFNNKPVVRFDGIRSATVGDFMHGNGNLSLSNAYTSFLVYLEAETNVIEQLPSLIGTPGTYNSVRSYYIRGSSGITNEMAFATWANDYGSGFRIPINKSRIWTLRLNETKTQIEYFDADGLTNFTTSRTTQELITPAAGYYVGGVNFPSTQLYHLKGDIAELIYFQGKLTDAERIAVENYLRQKYFSAPITGGLFYQWSFNGLPIVGATNSSLTLNHVQSTNAGAYSVIVSNLFGATISSNALLTVIQPNRAPVAVPQSLSVDEDNALPIKLLAADADGDLLSYTIGIPTNGTVTGTAPNLIYQPNSNFHGADSFTFKVNDGKTDSTIATISITVVPVNDPPVAQSQSASVDEDHSLSLTLVAADVDGDILTYTFTAPTHGVLTGTPPNLTYKPSTNYFGTDSFTFTAKDAQVDSAAATVSITIVSVNDAPIAIAQAKPSFLFSSNEISTVIISPNGSNAAVVLDGSLSYDIESNALDYAWSEGTNLLANGEIVTNSLAVGTHTITLVVNDGADSGADTIVVDVITPADAIAELVAFLDASALPQKRKQPLLSTLSAAIRSFSRDQAKAGINQLKAFAKQVDAQVDYADPELAADLLHILNEILAVIDAPPAP